MSEREITAVTRWETLPYLAGPATRRAGRAAAAIIPFLLAVWVVELSRDGKPVGLAAIGAGLVVFVVVAFLADTFRRVTVIAPLLAPKAAADLGMTGEVCARRIADTLSVLAAAGVSRDHPLLLDAGLPPPSLELPGTKLSAAWLADGLRRVIGSRRVEVGGEIVAMTDGACRIRLRSGSQSFDAGPAALDELRNLLDAASLMLAERIAPLNMALALCEVDAIRAREIAAAAGGAARHSARVRAACLNVAALLHFRAEEDEQGDRAVALARSVWGWDPMTVAILRWRASERGQDAIEDRQRYDVLEQRTRQWRDVGTIDRLFWNTQLIRSQRALERFQARVLKQDIDWTRRRIDAATADLDRAEVSGGWSSWAGRSVVADSVRASLERAEATLQRAFAEPDLTETAMLVELQDRLEPLRRRLLAAAPAIAASIEASRERDAWIKEIVADQERLDAERRRAELAQVDLWRQQAAEAAAV